MRRHVRSNSLLAERSEKTKTLNRRGNPGGINGGNIYLQRVCGTALKIGCSRRGVGGGAKAEKLVGLRITIFTLFFSTFFKVKHRL